ncbi:hypothetical protein QBZ16_004545 [Prototheca wickerhamii]|uniref:Beta-amylase n=1 Tax=Prototheca wickerhamii TaxID=3111 RepID=A0AAD9MGY6_PROWI|nr:hypothetical protein QBZ16_004545 [Prototheca wickerhamii]
MQGWVPPGQLLAGYTAQTQPGLAGAAASPEPPPASPRLQRAAVPVLVMLPLDTVDADGSFRYANSEWFSDSLRRLAASGVHGVAVDVWWGAVERSPRRYDWQGYRELFRQVSAAGLRLQAVMSFHACGGNVGDDAEVPLPEWALAVGDRDPDIFFADRPRGSSPGQRVREVLSWHAEEEPGLLRGRSILGCYGDFMRAFRDEFAADLGGLIEEVVVGCGPCGELRYPSYPETNGWRFPGIGEFQCFDRRALASLAQAAAAAGHPEWGTSGPMDAGTYNSSPEETVFFRGRDGGWQSPYGKFFLEWYSNCVVEHGDRMLSLATAVFRDGGGRASGAGGGAGGAARDGTRGEHIVESSGASRDELSTPKIAQPSAAGAPLRSPGGEALASAFAEWDAGGAANWAGVSRFAALGENPNDAFDFASRLAAGLPRPASSLSVEDDGPGGAAEEERPAPRARAAPARGLTLSVKIAGVHWWYQSASHAAELTAGYYNVPGRDGYDALCALCARHGAAATLTCVEMCDAQHPPEALCGPEGVLRQVRESAAAWGVALAGENALPCFRPTAIDEAALDRMAYNTAPWGSPLEERRARHGEGGGDCAAARGTARAAARTARRGARAPRPRPRSPFTCPLCGVYGSARGCVVICAAEPVASASTPVHLVSWSAPAEGACRVVAQREFEARISALSWTASGDGLLVAADDGGLSMLAVPAGPTASVNLSPPRLAPRWSTRPPEAQRHIAAGRALAAPSASAPGAGARDTAVSIWWAPSEPARGRARSPSPAKKVNGAPRPASPESGSPRLLPAARREKLRHPGPVLQLGWSGSALPRPAAVVPREEDAPRATQSAGCPALLTLAADGTLRIWVEMVLASWAADGAPQEETFFCMALVLPPPAPSAVLGPAMILQGPAPPAEPRLACWVEDAFGPQGDGADDAPSSLLWLVTRFAARAEDRPGSPAGRPAAPVPTLTCLYAVRGLRAISVASWALSVEDEAGAEPPRGGQAQALLWGTIREQAGAAGWPCAARDFTVKPVRRADPASGAPLLIMLAVSVQQFAMVPAAGHSPGDALQPLTGKWSARGEGLLAGVRGVLGGEADRVAALDAASRLTLWSGLGGGLAAPVSRLHGAPAAPVLAVTVLDLGHGADSAALGPLHAPGTHSAPAPDALVLAATAEGELQVLDPVTGTVLARGLLRRVRRAGSLNVLAVETAPLAPGAHAPRSPARTPRRWSEDEVLTPRSTAARAGQALVIVQEADPSGSGTPAKEAWTLCWRAHRDEGLLSNSLPVRESKGTELDRFARFEVDLVPDRGITTGALAAGSGYFAVALSGSIPDEQRRGQRAAARLRARRRVLVYHLAIPGPAVHQLCVESESDVASLCWLPHASSPTLAALSALGELFLIGPGGEGSENGSASWRVLSTRQASLDLSNPRAALTGAAPGVLVGQEHGQLAAYAAGSKRGLGRWAHEERGPLPLLSMRAALGLATAGTEWSVGLAGRLAIAGLDGEPRTSLPILGEILEDAHSCVLEIPRLLDAAAAAEPLTTDALSSGTLDLGAFGMFGGEEPAAEPAPQPVSSTLDTGMLDLAAFGMDSGAAHAPAPAQELVRPSEAASTGMLDLAAFGMAEMSPAPQPAPAPAVASPRAEEPQLPRLRALGCVGRLPPAAGSQVDSQAVLESIEHLRTREGKLSADGSPGDSAADLLEACLVPSPLLVGVQQRVDAGGASYLRLLHGAVAQSSEEAMLEAGLELVGRVDSLNAHASGGPSEPGGAFAASRPSSLAPASPLTWENLRRLGAGFWLRDERLMADTAEAVAKARFAASKRNPESCALLYIALGKRAALQGLYRAAGQRRQADFLARNFAGDEASRRAAAKNAFVLLGQHRPELAAAFFLLGGCVRDALDVCARELRDVQLALFLRRLVVAARRRGGDGVAPLQGPIPSVASLVARVAADGPAEARARAWIPALTAAVEGDDAALLGALCESLPWTALDTTSVAQGLPIILSLLRHTPTKAENWSQAVAAASARLRDGPSPLVRTLLAQAAALLERRLPALAVFPLAAACAADGGALSARRDAPCRAFFDFTMALTLLSSGAELVREDVLSHAARGLKAAGWPVDPDRCLDQVRRLVRASFAAVASPEDGGGALARAAAARRGQHSQHSAAPGTKPPGSIHLTRTPIVAIDRDRCGTVAVCPLRSRDGSGSRPIVISTRRHGLIAADVFVADEEPTKIVEGVPETSTGAIGAEDAGGLGQAATGASLAHPLAGEHQTAHDAPSLPASAALRPVRTSVDPPSDPLSSTTTTIFSRVMSTIFDQARWEEGSAALLQATALIAHPSFQYFLSADTHGFVHLWEFGRRDALDSFTPMHDGDLDGWGSGSLWSLGSLLFSSPSVAKLGGWGRCAALAWAPSGDAFAGVGQGGVVAVWDLERATGGPGRQADADGHLTAEWWHRCLGREGHALCYIDASTLVGAVARYDLRAGEREPLWAVRAPGPHGAVTSAARLPEPGLVALGHADGTLSLLDGTGAAVHVEVGAHGALDGAGRRGHAAHAAVASLVACPEGLLSAGLDGRVHLWTLSGAA